MKIFTIFALLVVLAFTQLVLSAPILQGRVDKVQDSSNKILKEFEVSVEGINKQPYPVKSGLCFEKGNSFRLKADGNPSLGHFVKNTGPDGISGPNFWTKIVGQRYNIVPGYKHGSLMYAFVPSDTELGTTVKNKNIKWYSYDDKNPCCRVEQAGCLIFLPNDKEVYNNKGHFNVKIFNNDSP